MSQVAAYHIYKTPGPSLSSWQCDAADGNDATVVEGYGKTPQEALKNCRKAVKEKKKR